MKRITLAWALTLCSFITFIACSSPDVGERSVSIIPAPAQMTVGEGTFTIHPGIEIGYADESLKGMGELLSNEIEKLSGIKLASASDKESNCIIFLELTDPKEFADLPKAYGLSPKDSVPVDESYSLSIQKRNIYIKATTLEGIYRGITTLKQIVGGNLQPGGEKIYLPLLEVKDAPRFAWRGLSFDVSRCFFDPEEVKQVIDMVALYKMNVLHMHLSDNQGWRIEIKKYPELTQIGSKRKETVIGHNSGTYDGKEYGGFYTQDQIRDVINYAAERHITIIPEIDMPGHQLAALATYPELGCTGGPYDVWGQWGVADDVICAGNEKSMQFLEDVLSEVIDLFPSEYIHVGGDECPKVRWEKCPKCQARIKAEGIKGDKKHSAEEYLQSYVISRMEKFVESKGRHIIGWDEILEGGLAPNATVMSWRGMDGGIEAAKQKHNVVMTPNTYVYLDYYQSADTDLEPDAIGGYLPLEKVYSFEPTAGISPEDQKYVIGAQANLWTEYIPTFSQVEYMTMPRIDAVADIQWSDPSKKDYQTFLPRVARMTQLYDRLGYNYGKHIFDINASLTTNTENGTLDIALTKLGEGDIYYTVDGSDPTIASIKYEGPVQINQDCEFKAIVVRPNGTSRIFSEDIFFNKATMKPITLKEQPSKGYVFNGAQVLVDGLRGGSNYKTGHWLGFQGKDLDATIDLKEPTEIQKVSFNTNVVKGDWIMGASAVTVKVSDDGKNFKEVASKKIPELTQNDKDGLYPQEISFAPVKARYVEVIINSSKLPKWHGGAGSPAFLFVDEIEIL